jgi:type IV pilus assembly protein PilM
VREIALPYLPEKELRASLGFQVQEFIPMSVDEAVLDYDPIGEFEQDDRRMLRMLLVAAQRQMVDTVVSAATGAKLEPVGLDLVPFAMVRSVGTTGVGMDLEDDGDEAVIDIGAHVTNIVVHAQGTVRFVRILPSGGRDITIAIARGAGVDDELAERLKRGEEVSLEDLAARPAEPEPDEPTEPTEQVAQRPDVEPGERPDLATPDRSGAPDLARVREIAMQRAASFVDEIRSSLEFYTAQAQGARIARVIVTGGGSKLDGFLELLRQRIPVQVDPGHVFQHARSQLSLSDEALAEAEPVLAVAVGLAIPGRDT